MGGVQCHQTTLVSRESILRSEAQWLKSVNADLVVLVLVLFISHMSRVADFTNLNICSNICGWQVSDVGSAKDTNGSGESYVSYTICSISKKSRNTNLLTFSNSFQTITGFVRYTSPLEEFVRTNKREDRHFFTLGLGGTQLTVILKCES